MASVISGASLVAVGLLIVALGILSALRRLPLNAIAGLRCPSTMASDAAWRHSHQKAAPWTIVSGVGPLVAGLATIITQDVSGMWPIAGVVWMLIVILIASYVATQAANRLTEDVAERTHRQ